MSKTSFLRRERRSIPQHGKKVSEADMSNRKSRTVKKYHDSNRRERQRAAAAPNAVKLGQKNYLSSSFSISSFQPQYGVWSLTTESMLTRSVEKIVHSERWYTGSSTPQSRMMSMASL